MPVFTSDDDLAEALAELGESEVGAASVLEGERLAGLLSVTEVTRALEVGAPTRRVGQPDLLHRIGVTASRRLHALCLPSIETDPIEEEA